MRERGEVAGAAEAAVLADDRGDAGVQHGGVGLGDDRACARAAGHEGGQAQEHGGAHHLALDLRPGARGVAEHQRPLQLLALGDRDVLGRECAEPGGDPVMRLVVAGEGLDDGASRGHCLERRRIQFDPLVPASHRDHVLERRGADAQRDTHVHK